MADTATQDPMVKAFFEKNGSWNGRLLYAGMVHEVPRSIATEYRDRGVARKPTKEELATFKAASATPNFGEEPDEAPAEDEEASE